MKTSQANAVWAALLVAGVGYEITALRMRQDDATLTRFTRRVARTHHPMGKAAFTIGWSAFSFWWVSHVIRGGLG